MKRYLLFSYYMYEPYGGWNDFRDSYDSKEEAIAAGQVYKSNGEKYHVVDTNPPWKIVAES